MDSKFMQVKKVVIPMLTAILLVAQLAPGFAISNKEVTTLIADSPSITMELYSPGSAESAFGDTITLNAEAIPQASAIEHVQQVLLNTTASDLASAATVTPVPYTTWEGSENKLGFLTTAQLNNFPSMRSEIERIFNTTETFGVKEGPLYYKGDNTRFSGFLGNYYPSIKANTENLRNAAANSFKDVTGKEWFADKLALMTYYGVIAGKPTSDGNFIFDPNAPVTRAEFVTMMGRAYYTALGFLDRQGIWPELYPGQKDTWWSPFASYYQADTWLNPVSGLKPEHMSQPMYRFECVYLMNHDLLDSIGYNTKGDAKSYFTDVVKRPAIVNELGLVTKINDYSSSLTKDFGLSVMNEMIAHPEKGLHPEIYDALARAYETKLFVGTPDHKSNWNKPVTRAEAAQLIWNMLVVEWGLEGDTLGVPRS